VATFTPRRNNTTLAIFMPMVTYSMHVYILGPYAHGQSFALISYFCTRGGVREGVGS